MLPTAWCTVLALFCRCRFRSLAFNLFTALSTCLYVSPNYFFSLFCGFLFRGILLFQALGVFGLSQIVAFVNYVRTKLNNEEFEILFKNLLGGFFIIFAIVGTFLALSGKCWVIEQHFLCSIVLFILFFFQVKLHLGLEDSIRC